jgi:ABC-type cobalamin/Fe3+-siderophores transport system ATPase subunit
LKATNDEPDGFDRRFVAHMDSLRTSTPEDIDRILIWVPNDRLTLKLTTDGKEESDIDTGSAGQRTAGMLTLLMSLGDEPLIIDQPEDDLDSRLITDLVVEGFRKLKTHRQLIIVTHNPNVSVNGCAENIVEMKFGAGQLNANVYGALQNKESRHAVCEVMEGGKMALDNRYFRISKAIAE